MILFLLAVVVIERAESPEVRSVEYGIAPFS
jgi:hypothetical protein